MLEFVYVYKPMLNRVEEIVLIKKFNILSYAKNIVLFRLIILKLNKYISSTKIMRQETGQHGAVKVWQRDLQSCWECSSLCYIPVECQTTTIVASLHL